MAQQGRKKTITKEKSTLDYFSWSDEGVELLLNVAIDYKASKAMENINWESCQNKYQDMKKYIANYPSPEQAAALEKIYPDTTEEMNKAILTTKLKSIRQKYRKAVDSGRKSAGSELRPCPH